MDPIDTLSSQIEALLFSAGRAMSIRQLAMIIGATPKAVTATLQNLEQFYKENNRGTALVIHDKKVQMVTNPRHGELIERFTKEEFTGPLSRAALETLAIVSYRGPIDKPEIDAVRGVNSAIMLRSLLVRGLVERKHSRKDARTYVYSASFDFIRHLGITQLSELPNYEKLHNDKVMERFAKQSSDASMSAKEESKSNG